MKKTRTYSIYTGCDRKVIPCRFLQNFRKGLKIFGWNLRTLQFLAFLAERESERDLPTSGRENGWWVAYVLRTDNACCDCLPIQLWLC